MEFCTPNVFGSGEKPAPKYQLWSNDEQTTKSQSIESQFYFPQVSIGSDIPFCRCAEVKNIDPHHLPTKGVISGPGTHKENMIWAIALNFRQVW